MDPEANLAEQLRLCELISVGDHDESDVDRLVELVLSLHGWLCGGGFLPARWTPSDDRKLASVMLAAVKLDRQAFEGQEGEGHVKFRETIERLVRAKR